MGRHCILIYTSLSQRDSLYADNPGLGLHDPCLASNSMLVFILRGVHRLPIGDWQPPRLLNTLMILHLLLQSWSSWPPDRHYDASMLWVASTVRRIFCFMRAGEFTCPSLTLACLVQAMCWWTHRIIPRLCPFICVNRRMIPLVMG